MSHTNLSAAEIALLDSQLPDIGGAIRGKPVTPDGGRLAGGRVVLCLNPQRVWPASLRVATGAPALVAVAARSARRPARAPIPAAARDPVLNTAIRPRRATATATAVVVADPHNHQPERSLRPMGTVSGKRCVKQIVYDLEKHWLFWKDTGGAVTLEELERLALYEPNIRGQAIFGDPLRTKPVRVLVNISAEGLSLWETGKHISHRWADRTPPDLSGFAELLKGILP
jgi:hypothetical protein